MSSNFDKNCPLCIRKKLSHWHYEDSLIVIMNCISCSSKNNFVPMAIIKRHDSEPTLVERAKCHIKLIELANLLGWKNYKLDDSMKKIPSHYHLHLRRVFSNPISKKCVACENN